MKATIRYTKIKSFVHVGAFGVRTVFGNEPGVQDDAIARVTEITHCIPLPPDRALIMLTNGNSIPTSTPIDEIERRIDEAEEAKEEPVITCVHCGQQFGPTADYSNLPDRDPDYT